MIDERRTFRSRFFRYTLRVGVRKTAVALMVTGWALALYANTSNPQDDASVHLAFAGTLLGGALAFMGMFAGISKWVAEPAAQKIMIEHINRGAMAHPELMPRPEYDTKHIELMNDVSDIKVMVAEMAGRSGGMSRSRERKP